MIGKKIQTAIDEQINAEIWSAYLYLSMSAYFERQNLRGFANWMKIQWQEEVTHAIKFFDYVHSRGGQVSLKPIAAVQIDWKNAIEVFSETLKHEQHVTALINNLANIAVEEKDHATNSMLQWFIAEQVEEEANAEQILVQLKMIGDNGYGLLMLDRELASRVFVDATKAANNL
ncbi:MAG: ferritin [Porphyromonadaceae bacterium]|nr:MAG: ferritin [Porphyromonadaceae bacterium]